MLKKIICILKLLMLPFLIYRIVGVILFFGFKEIGLENKNIFNTLFSIGIITFTMNKFEKKKSINKSKLKRLMPIWLILIPIYFTINQVMGGVDIGLSKEKINILFLINLIFSAVSEEYFFRGYLYRKSTNILNKYISVAVITFVFTIIHSYSIKNITLVPLALFFTLVYAQTESILYVSILHIIINIYIYSTQIFNLKIGIEFLLLIILPVISFLIYLLVIKLHKFSGEMFNINFFKQEKYKR